MIGPLALLCWIWFVTQPVWLGYVNVRGFAPKKHEATQETITNFSRSLVFFCGDFV